MFTTSRESHLLCTLIILGLFMYACVPAAPTQVKIIETVVVEKEAETVVQTVEVLITATAADEQSTEVDAPSPEIGGPIPADGLIPCPPIPELPETASLQIVSMTIHPEQQPALLAPEVYRPQESGKAYRVGTYNDVVSTNFFAAAGNALSSTMLPQRLRLLTGAPKYFTTIPQVASELPKPLEKEGDMWVVKIPMREDIQWSDGTDFTAADYVFTINTILDMNIFAGGLGSYVDPKFLDHVEALDDHTVKIYYHTKPGYLRHEYGALRAPILSKAYWEPIVSEAMTPIEVLGKDYHQEDLEQAQIEAREILYAHDPRGGEPYAGGFTIEKWEPGAFLELKANPNYFERGKDVQLWSDGAYNDSHGLEIGTPEGEPEITMAVGPHVESVVYSIYGSPDAAVLAMKKGDIDFLFGFTQLQRGLADQIRTDPNFEVVENPSYTMRYMSFNNRRRPMNDCAFRQAVAVLIDKEFMTDEILQGSVQPLYNYVPTANTLWYNDEILKLGENLTRAERTELATAILKGAGYTWEGDGEPTWDEENRSVVPAGRLLMPDGTPVPSLNMLSPGPGYDPMRSTFAIWIENWLNEFGIPLEAELEGFNEMIPKIFIDQDFDMYILGWSLWETPEYLYDFFASEYAVIDGDNAGGYENPEYDELAYQLLTCETFQDCKNISDQAQMVLTTELPYVVLFDTGRTDAFRRDSVEYPYTEVLGGLFDEHGDGLMQSLVMVK